MANPDATTLPGPDFIDTLPPTPPAPAPARRPRSDAADRLVFFFSGFDPKGATFYHRLFRSGIAQRNASHDETLAVGGRRRIGRWASVWTALWRGAPAAGIERPATMRTRVHFMRWEDLVRRHWRREAGQLARDYWNVYLRGLLDGVLWRIRRQSASAFGLALLPLGVLLFSLMCGLLLASVGLLLPGVLPAASALGLGMVAGLLGWRALARSLDCEWLLRLFAFMREKAIGQAPAVDVRLEELADRVVEAVEARLRQPDAGPLQEVMFVGYSTGSVMAPSVLARALARLEELLDSRRTGGGATLAMVTLGHCVPIASEWPGARRFRADLDLLSECTRLTWHDYSSSADRAAFWRQPPWPVPARLHGHQGTPRFRSRRPSAVEYAAQRRDHRDTHLQYLQPPTSKSDTDTYDFFALICGPATLAQRHSALRVDVRVAG